MCSAAQMRIDPQDGLNTRPPLPDWARRLQGDKGQAWPSCALTLHGCPLTLLVGGPPCLPLTLQDLFLFSLPPFRSHCALSLSLTLAVSYLLASSLPNFHLLLFISTHILSSVSLFLFFLPSSLLNSWVDMPAGEASPLFLVLLSFPPSLSLHPPSLSCAPPWHWRDQFTRQQLRQASFVPGLSSEKAFFASVLWWHWPLNCATSKFGSLVL